MAPTIRLNKPRFLCVQGRGGECALQGATSGRRGPTLKWLESRGIPGMQGQAFGTLSRHPAQTTSNWAAPPPPLPLPFTLTLNSNLTLTLTLT